MILVLSMVADITRSFDKTMLKYKNKPMFVEFYAPWCHNCTAISEGFEEIGMIINKRDMLIAKVDCV